jgi:hypothetical protein
MFNTPFMIQFSYPREKPRKLGRNVTTDLTDFTDFTDKSGGFVQKGQSFPCGLWLKIFSNLFGIVNWEEM